MIFLIVMAITYLVGIGATWQMTDSDWETPGPLFRAIGWPFLLPILVGMKSGYILDAAARREAKQVRAAKAEAEVLKIRADAAVHEARETEALRARYEILGLDTSGFGDVNPKVRARVLQEMKS